MSTARQAPALADGRHSDDWPTAVLPAVLPAVPVRRSILRPTRPSSQAGPLPFEDWRGQAVTEELAAVAAPRRGTCPARRPALARHLRSALTGTLLAVVAAAGLSSYAAQGVADARPTAPRQAHITCR